MSKKSMLLFVPMLVLFLYGVSTTAVEAQEPIEALAIGTRTADENPGPFLQWPLPDEIARVNITRLPDSPWTHNFLGITDCPPYPALIDKNVGIKNGLNWSHSFPDNYDDDYRSWIKADSNESRAKWENDSPTKDAQFQNAIACYSANLEIPLPWDHAGTDIHAANWTLVSAAAEADQVIVEKIISTDSNGNTRIEYKIALRHSNVNGSGQTWYTIYKHLSLPASEYPVGTRNVHIPAGSIIGYVGQGHLHFETSLASSGESFVRNPWGIDEEPWDGCLWLPETNMCPLIPDVEPEEEGEQPSTGHFPDVPTTSGQFKYIEALWCIGAVGGYSDGNYHPTDNVTREAIAKIIIKTLGREPDYTGITPYFSDVPATHTFFDYIQDLKALDITTTEGLYYPSDPISRGGVAKLIVRAGGVKDYTSCQPPFSDVPCSHAFYPEIRKLKEIFDAKGIQLGYSDGTFRPDEMATREAVAKYVVVGLDKEDWMPPFLDVLCDHPFFDHIKAIAERKITDGYSDGTYYKPDVTLTRGGAAKFVIRGMGETPVYNDTTPPFSDVTVDSTVFYTEVRRLKELGITSGYSDGTYKPDDAMTRGGLAKFIVKGLEILGVECRYDTDPGFSDVNSSHIFYREIQCLKELGITSGFSDGTFHPDDAITRGAAAKFINLAFVQRTYTVLPEEESTETTNDNCLNGPVFPFLLFFLLPPNDSDCFGVTVLADGSIEGLEPDDLSTTAITTQEITQTYEINQETAGLNANLKFELLDIDGTTVLTTVTGKAQEGGTTLSWMPPASGTYYIRLSNTNPYATEGIYTYLDIDEVTTTPDTAQKVYIPQILKWW